MFATEVKFVQSKFEKEKNQIIREKEKALKEQEDKLKEIMTEQ